MQSGVEGNQNEESGKSDRNSSGEAAQLSETNAQSQGQSTSTKQEEESHEWDLCGDYNQILDSSNNDEEWGRKRSSMAETPATGDNHGDDFVCCGDMGADDSTPTVSTKTPMTNSTPWGENQRDDLSETQSLQTSRISNTSR